MADDVFKFFFKMYFLKRNIVHIWNLATTFFSFLTKISMPLITHRTKLVSTSAPRQESMMTNSTNTPFVELEAKQEKYFRPRLSDEVDFWLIWERWLSWDWAEKEPKECWERSLKIWARKMKIKSWKNCVHWRRS